MAPTQLGVSRKFHEVADFAVVETARDKLSEETPFVYTFDNFIHPHVATLIERLNSQSLSGLFDPGWHKTLREDFFKEYYEIAKGDLVGVKFFPKEIDVKAEGAYSNYNWELLFHIPVAIAVHLGKAQRFAEAQRWFHYVFDPTCTDDVTPLQRFWKFIAFREPSNPEMPTQLDEVLTLLCTPAEDLANDDQRKAKAAIESGYNAILDHPFHPHVVARTRPVAYQYYVVMKYLDNLIAWGDSLFRQDTIESINEATQLYVLASNILGRRPQRIPPSGAVQPKTYAQLKAAGVSKNKMNNALVELEGSFSYLLASVSGTTEESPAAGPLFGMGETLYFAVPPNEKLLGYWDLVADRLFKIRHCMNIEGVVRQLALFDPPIDPGMLVKAAAAGIDIGSVLSGLNQPVGPVRCQLLIQKALELCAEVRGLGGALLSAIEKGDGEHLASLRQKHEIALQQMIQDVRYLQWQQARESTESLLRGRASAVERYKYYQRLLGLTVDTNAVPDSLSKDERELTEDNFDEAYGALIGQYDKTVGASEYGEFETRDEGKLRLHVGEYDELNQHADRAFAFRTAVAATDAVSAGLSTIPVIGVKAAYWGVGVDSKLGGSDFFANVGRFASSGLSMLVQNEEWQGQFASKTASYGRRADEWILQSRLAACELMQIGRQVLGSLIAEQVARHDYENAKTQIEQSKAVEDFLRDKFTNEALYTWMQGELSRLYYEYYRFAFDTARKAEKTMKDELMRPEVDATDYIKFNYWDGGRKGLLCAEPMYLDIKRMELAYHEHNKREYELTKHVSLRPLDPLALLALRATGMCDVSLPEWLFDIDAPGHYMRRIKSVAVSIPGVTGPNTSIHCTLSLLKSSLRRSPLGEDYERQGTEDDRFLDRYGTIQSVVTSSGVGDAGLFETNLRDERFLPFEGAGAYSTWKIELPAEFRQFDYDTISDVVIHLRYTARQGGEVLRQKATEALQTRVSEASDLVQLFSLPEDFPAEWHAFVTAEEDDNLEITIKKEHFPYLAQGRDLTFSALHLFGISESTLHREVLPPRDVTPIVAGPVLVDGGETTLSLVKDDDVLRRKAGAKVFLVCRYSLGVP